MKKKAKKVSDASATPQEPERKGTKNCGRELNTQQLKKRSNKGRHNVVRNQNLWGEGGA